MNEADILQLADIYKDDPEGFVEVIEGLSLYYNKCIFPI